MARSGGFEDQITPSVVQDAIVQIMQGDLGRSRNVDVHMARDMAGRIFTSVQKMGFHGASGSMLSGNAAFHTLVTQHLGSPVAAAYDPAFRQQLQQAIERANITGSDFIAGVKAGVQIGLQYAALHDGRMSSDAGGDGRRAGSAQSYRAELPTNFTADNLSPTLSSLVDTGQGITAGHVAEAANFAQRIGVAPGAYTGYFVGSTPTVRAAIQNHVQNGAKITDEHVKNNKDATAIIGAIRAGKMKREDAPPSVQKIIEDMEKKGIDPLTADPKALEGYFKDNPKALEAAKAEAAKLIDADRGKTDAQVTKEATDKINGAAAPDGSPSNAPPANNPPAGNEAVAAPAAKAVDKNESLKPKVTQEAVPI